MLNNMNTRDFEVFTNMIKDRVQEQLGEEYEVTIETKHNVNRDRTGLCIWKNSITQNDLPVEIYLEVYYAAYVWKKIPMGQIASDLILTYKKAAKDKPGRDEFQFLYDWTLAREELAFKIINYEKNEEFLKNISHIRFLDLAIVFYIELAKIDGSLPVKTSLLKIWNITLHELYQAALENTPKIFPPVRRKMSDLHDELFEYCEEADDADDDDEKFSSIHMVTNTRHVNGFATILYPGYMEQLAEEEGSDLLILPSSVHECLVIPVHKDSESYMEELRTYAGMVSEVNESNVSEADFLSNTLYLYERETDALRIVNLVRTGERYNKYETQIER